MKRKRLLVLLAAPGALALASTVAVLWPRPSRITRENYDRIRVGMSRAEVEGIFGAPPGLYTNGPTDLAGDFESAIGFHGSNIMVWGDDTLLVYVGFDYPGRIVESKTVLNVKRRDQGVLENLLWRLKRQWRRLFP